MKKRRQVSGDGYSEDEEVTPKELERMRKKTASLSNKTEDRFPKCPNCGLPTHGLEGEDMAYCASCNICFDVKRPGDKKPKLEKAKRSGYKRAGVIAVAFVIVIIISVGSLSYFLFQSKGEESIINIDDVSEIRELEKKEDVPRRSMSQGEFADYLQDGLDDEARRDLWEQETLLKCLFAVDEDFDLIGLAENSTGAGVAGFYDTDTKDLYIIGEYHSSYYINYILSHELTHALQDQHFDLDNYIEGNSYDEDLARLSAVEGDAMITMEMWADENLDDMDKLLISVESLAQLFSGVDMTSAEEGSEILGSMNYLPYTAGMDFVNKVYSDSGWEGVNGLLSERPPLSTEQILHYDKYIDYEEPIEVTFDLEIENMELGFSTTVGEALLSECLAYNMDSYGGIGSIAFTGSYENSGLANGWGGDVFKFYEGEGSFLSVLVTEWDSEVENRFHLEVLEQIFDEIGMYWMEEDVYRVGTRYVRFEGNGTSTCLFCSDSLEVLNNLE